MTDLQTLWASTDKATKLNLALSLLTEAAHELGGEMELTITDKADRVFVVSVKEKKSE